MNKQLVKEVVSDMLSGFLYYDRKEDEDLPVGAIESMIASGDLTVSDIVEMFSQELTERLKGTEKETIV